MQLATISAKNTLVTESSKIFQRILEKEQKHLFRRLQLVPMHEFKFKETAVHEKGWWAQNFDCFKSLPQFIFFNGVLQYNQVIKVFLEQDLKGP